MFFRMNKFAKSAVLRQRAFMSSERKLGNMSWKSFGIVVASVSILVGYFEIEKYKLQKRKEEAKMVSYGKPLVGGPFSLVDHFGKPVTDLDFRGKYMLIYFGYTFCPDVCPEELEKMGSIVDALDARKDLGDYPIVPIFVSCDPKRDSVELIKEYLQEFHPKFLGLTGTYQQIKRIAKQYRMYFSAPPLAVDDDTADYLVDHSIFFYLMGPNGEYLAHFSRADSMEHVVDSISKLVHNTSSKV